MKKILLIFAILVKIFAFNQINIKFLDSNYSSFKVINVDDKYNINKCKSIIIINKDCIYCELKDNNE